MKTKSYLIGLLCIGALAGLLAISKAPAQGNGQRDPAFVELRYLSRYIESQNKPSEIVLVTAYGNGLPEIEIGMNLAEACVKLEKAGLTPEPAVVYGQIIFRR